MPASPRRRPSPSSGESLQVMPRRASWAAPRSVSTMPIKVQLRPVWSSRLRWTSPSSLAGAWTRATTPRVWSDPREGPRSPFREAQRARGAELRSSLRRARCSEAAPAEVCCPSLIAQIAQHQPCQRVPAGALQTRLCALATMASIVRSVRSRKLGQAIVADVFPNDGQPRQVGERWRSAPGPRPCPHQPEHHHIVHPAREGNATAQAGAVRRSGRDRGLLPTSNDAHRPQRRAWALRSAASAFCSAFQSHHSQPTMPP